MTTDAISRVGSTMSGCTRTRLSEKVGTRLTIMTATNTRTTALSGQLRDQPPVTKESIIGVSARAAAAGAGMPVKKK